MESPGKKFTDLVDIESIQDTDLAVIRNDTGVKVCYYIINIEPVFVSTVP